MEFWCLVPAAEHDFGYGDQLRGGELFGLMPDSTPTERLWRNR